MEPAAAMFVGILAALFALNVLRYAAVDKNKKEEDRCLADHAAVPLFAKVFVPSLLSITFALFSFSNRSVGASVSLTISVGTHDLINMNLFDFSLINTTKEMWNAGAYALSLLVAIWSGLWPYVKIILMFTAWYAPPQYLSRPHRRRLLLMMDVLGKWALIDLFLMNMMEVAFRFHLKAVGVLADVEVTPEVGLFGFITAVAGSLAANTMILVYHRNATHVLDDDSLGVSTDPVRDPDDETLNASLLWSYPDETDDLGFCPRDSWFERGTVQALNTRDNAIVAAASNRVKVSSLTYPPGALPAFIVDAKSRRVKRWVWPCILISLLSCLPLILVAANIDAFEFVYTGVAGTLIAMVDETQQVRRCSLITIARQLAMASEDASQFGILYQQMLYLLFALVFPLLVVLVVFCLITFRLNLFELKVTFYALEVGMANASLDVFIVAIVAAVLQVNQFAQFLEKPICDPLNVLVPGLGSCFTVETKLLPGCWLVVGAAAYFWCLMQCIQRIVERAVSERERHVLMLCDSSVVGCTVRCA